LYGLGENIKPSGPTTASRDALRSGDAALTLWPRFPPTFSTVSTQSRHPTPQDRSSDYTAFDVVLANGRLVVEPVIVLMNSCRPICCPVAWTWAGLLPLMGIRIGGTSTITQIKERLKKEGPHILFEKLEADRKNFAGLDKALQNFYQYLFVWAPMYTDYRFQILDRLKDLFGDPGDRLRILTPAILDFDNWLGNDIDHPTLPADQADLMQLISLVQDPTRFAVHGLIGFDPWRYLDHPKTGLAVVRKAIEEQGFVGVKIYPPMGFRASGNDQLQDTEFPKGLWKHRPNIEPFSF
jgi:hypothetical protein